jgi:hypothetical protein
MTDDEALDSIAARLEAERPLPGAAFRGDTRRALLAEAERRPAAPRRLRLVIAAFAGSGTALLAIAAIGLAGVGPLAPG